MSQGLLAPLAAVAVTLATATACTSLDDPHGANRSTSLPIIGGTFDAGDDAIVEVEIDRVGFCTGTLVAPRVVMTAAHCVSEAIERGNTAGGTVRFGNGRDAWRDEIEIADMAMHRLYAPPSFAEWDIAALRLARDAMPDITPVALNLDPLEKPRDIGLTARAVGFGLTDGVNGTGFGEKRQVDLTIDEITFFHVGLGTATENICQGDSGGPILVRFGDVEKVVGVNSFGSDQCRARSFQTRVDSMQDWLLPVMDAWSGPCQLDGACVTEGCRSVDPDCDVCGFEGECGTDCPAVDLDCPLGARAGELCEDGFDCETRLCLEAADDPRLHYCTTTCDPARPLDTCPTPFSTCAAGPDGDPVCVYTGPTPSAQGAPCDEGDDCRSGVCDTGLEDPICVEECGEDLPECSAPYSCQEVAGTRACTLAGDQGGCALTAAPRRSPPPRTAWLLLLCAACWPLVRRRGRSVR